MATAVLRRDPVGDEWLDIEGASCYTKLSRHTVYDAVRTGGLRHVRVGRPASVAVQANVARPVA